MEYSKAEWDGRTCYIDRENCLSGQKVVNSDGNIEIQITEPADIDNPEQYHLAGLRIEEDKIDGLIDLLEFLKTVDAEKIRPQDMLYKRVYEDEVKDLRKAAKLFDDVEGAEELANQLEEFVNKNEDQLGEI